MTKTEQTVVEGSLTAHESQGMIITFSLLNPNQSTGKENFCSFSKLLDLRRLALPSNEFDFVLHPPHTASHQTESIQVT